MPPQDQPQQPHYPPPPNQGFPPQAPPPQDGGHPPHQQYPPPPYQQPPAVGTNGLAIAGFVLSFFHLFAIVGLVLSILGLKKSKKMNGKGKGLSIAGIIISIAVILLIVVGLATRERLEEITEDLENNRDSSLYNSSQVVQKQD